MCSLSTYTVLLPSSKKRKMRPCTFLRYTHFSAAPLWSKLSSMFPLQGSILSPYLTWHISSFSKKDLFNFFLYFCLCWVFIAEHGLSLVAVSRGHSSLWCTGFSLDGFFCWRAQALGAQALVVVMHGFICCGMGDLPRAGIEPVSPALQVDSQPLDHQRSRFSSFWHR